MRLFSDELDRSLRADREAFEDLGVTADDWHFLFGVARLLTFLKAFSSLCSLSVNLSLLDSSFNSVRLALRFSSGTVGEAGESGTSFLFLAFDVTNETLEDTDDDGF